MGELSTDFARGELAGLAGRGGLTGFGELDGMDPDGRREIEVVEADEADSWRRTGCGVDGCDFLADLRLNKRHIFDGWDLLIGGSISKIIKSILPRLELIPKIINRITT